MAEDCTSNMMRLIIFGVLLLMDVNGLSITGNKDMQMERKIEQPENIDESNKVLDNAACVNNLKSMMGGYVKENYKNLTIVDIENINEILVDFYNKFAREFKGILLDESVTMIECVDDGIPETTLDEIKEELKREYPFFKENQADEVMFILRKNSFETRKKISKIIIDRSVAES